jgi:hypothetical protein
MQLHEPSTRNVEQLAAVHVAQVISYLKAFDHSLGLLITFNPLAPLGALCVLAVEEGCRRATRLRR